MKEPDAPKVEEKPAPAKRKARRAPKKKAQARDQASVSYRDRYGEEHTHSFAVPLKQHGVAERILNAAEAHGSPDIKKLRAQLAKHYPDA